MVDMLHFYVRLFHISIARWVGQIVQALVNFAK